MGYHASWSGELRIKDSLNAQWNNCRKELKEVSRWCDSNECEDGTANILYPFGDGNYHDDEWYDFLNRFAEWFEADSSIEFSGEDGAFWRFRILKKPTNEGNWWVEENGFVQSL